MVKNALLIIERTFITDATALVQCKDDLRSLATDPHALQDLSHIAMKLFSIFESKINVHKHKHHWLHLQVWQAYSHIASTISVIYSTLKDHTSERKLRASYNT